MRNRLSYQWINFIHCKQQSTVILFAYNVEHPDTYSPPWCFRDVLVIDVSYEGQEWWPMSRRPIWIIRIKLLYPWDNLKQEIVGSACHLVLGCCVMKFGWLIWAQGMKNWWINRCYYNVHGCHQFFMLPVDVLFGNISMYPHDIKNCQMSHHNLRLPP